MGAIDDLLEANREYAARFPRAGLAQAPSRRLAVVCCMDARIDVYEALGLPAGGAHVIRNAGGLVTTDVLRSLVISQHALATRHVVVLAHTDCGLDGLDQDALAARVREATGADPQLPGGFGGFARLDEHVQVQVERVRSCPWIHPDTTVHGFVYDVHTGRLEAP